MRRIFRIAGFIVLLSFGAEPSAAQSTPQQANADYSPGEIVDAGSRFFGGVSSGLAHLVEHAVSQWGLPNGYILGQEATGAFVGGLRSIWLCIGRVPRLVGTSGAMALEP